jgi:hypothetical protein
MRVCSWYLLLSILAAAAVCAQAPAPAKSKPSGAPVQQAPRTRPRVVATTDGEIDDRCSMIRFLLYANEFEVEGLVYSSSRFHWLGQTWSGVEWINAQIGMYARVVSIRQACEGGRADLFLGEIGHQNAANGGSPDLQPAGDHGLADAVAV